MAADAVPAPAATQPSDSANATPAPLIALTAVRMLSPVACPVAGSAGPTQ